MIAQMDPVRDSHFWLSTNHTIKNSGYVRHAFLKIFKNLKFQKFSEFFANQNLKIIFCKTFIIFHRYYLLMVRKVTTHKVWVAPRKGYYRNVPVSYRHHNRPRPRNY